MPPDPPPRNLFQRVGSWAEAVVEWAEATFGDPALSALIRSDLGLAADGNPPPPTSDPATRAKIDAFAAKQDVDEAALAAVVAEVLALVETVKTFADAVDSDAVSAGDLFWLLFQVWVADSLRARNPAAYGLMKLVGLLLADEEALAQLDLGPLGRALSGDAAVDSAAVVDRLSFVVGTTVVMLDQLVGAVGGAIDAAYGWDPEPGSSPEAAAVAARTLSVRVRIPGSPAQPVVSLVGVPAEHGGPGVVVSIGGVLEVEHESGETRYVFTAGANGAFAVYAGKGGVRALSGFTPSFALRTEPTAAAAAAGRPALTVGTSGATRLEIGALAYGVEVGADHAGFRLAARRGKLVLALGQGDGFLRNLPGGGRVEVPFDVGLLADTTHGVRFEGGTGLKITLPVAASLFGSFTVQSLTLELLVTPPVALEVRGGFSVRLGPFQAAIDQVGTRVDLSALREGKPFGEIVTFVPPKGIGLRLDAGVVKGGGYLFVDAARGEYAGALELSFLGLFSLKAICLITTKRPDGSEGWSLLLLLFGQFSLHIAFGIFLTGVGGLIGLHHRVDTDALVAGMKTGALDDVLFPDNPVGDAPRIINRYRTLFPVEPNALTLGPMLELAFSQPPIVYIRLGLLFVLRNVLGGDKPVALTKVALIGQLLAQLPPKATGVPAILKLLIDVVGFYDAEEQFLMIRARLRDSFVGIEGFATINLSGELLLAMHFGDDPSFVLSAGGFHPAYKDLPPKVPVDLERLAVSFGIGPVSLRCENYFAVTSNSVQTGFAVVLSAKLGPARIDGRLAFDALIVLTPKFHFVVGVEFAVSLKAFGATLCAVHVTASLEGPGEWRFAGRFSFSILFWDVDVPFDVSWGSAPAIPPETTSAAQALAAALSDPARLLPEAPVGGNALVTLAAVPGQPDAPPLAHPLGRLTVRQKVLPFGVRIDRMGTRRLTEGTPTFAVTSVQVGGVDTGTGTTVTDHFARGQFTDLDEAAKLAGKAFERFPCGVTVGTAAYSSPGRRQHLDATYEEKILEPERLISRFPWTLVSVGQRALPDHLLEVHVQLGPAAASARAQATTLAAGGPGAAAVVLHDAPLTLLDPDRLTATGSLVPDLVGSAVAAEQVAAVSGAVVAAAYEFEGA